MTTSDSNNEEATEDILDEDIETSEDAANDPETRSVAELLDAGPDGVRGEDGRLDDDWLRHIHKSYIDRYLSDNQRIWSTAALLVPISLATFPAFVALKTYIWPQALIFAIFSISVMLFWIFIAEKHRSFQEQSLNRALAIEVYALGKDRSAKIHDAIIAGTRKVRPSVRTVRMLLLAVTVVLWVVIFVLVLLGQFTAINP